MVQQDIINKPFFVFKWQQIFFLPILKVHVLQKAITQATNFLYTVINKCTFQGQKKCRNFFPNLE